MNAGRPLEGDVSIVTGAAGGLGRATCQALADAGSIVVGTDLADRPEGVAAELWLRHDVTSADDWRTVAEEVERRYGRLDCLVNNAAIVAVSSIEDTTLEAWRRMLSINGESILLSFQALLPLLRATGARRAGGAAVVNVSSPAGVLGSEFTSAYSASKAVVTNLTKSAVKEFGKLRYPIRLNTLYPGGALNLGGVMNQVLADGYRQIGLMGSDDDDAERRREEGIARVPLGRTGDPAECAAAVVFLCSPAASYISGVDFPVHGGLMY